MIHENQYFDKKTKAYISNKDACSFEYWEKHFLKYPFAIHSKGFDVFLTPSEIEISDEYKNGDPNDISENIRSPFHQSRIEITIQLSKTVVESLNKTNIKILDIGCGEGHITKEVKRSFPQTEIYGFDHSFTAISKACDDSLGINFTVGEIEFMPYAPNYFDLVLCNNIWEHVPDPLLLLSSIDNVLKPNGYLIISTPNRYHIYNLIRVFLGRSCSLSPNHITEYSIGQILEQLNFVDFEIIQIVSKNIKEKQAGISKFTINFLIMPILKQFLRIIRSHHKLDRTIFYLAKKS